MRLFALILSIYILLLTGIPCCAMTCTREPVKKEHKQEKDCNECCSPFFCCQNCGGGFILQTKIDFRPADILFKRNTYPEPIQGSYQGYISGFWQPPRAA